MKIDTSKYGAAFLDKLKMTMSEKYTNNVEVLHNPQQNKVDCSVYMDWKGAEFAERSRIVSALWDATKNDSTLRVMAMKDGFNKVGVRVTFKTDEPAKDEDEVKLSGDTNRN